MARYRMPHVGRPSDLPVTHTQMNDTFQGVSNAQHISVSEPLTIQNTLGGGTRIGIILPAAAPAAVAAEPAVMAKQFKVISTAHSDVMQCLPFVGGQSGSIDLTWVAKPWFLRGANTWPETVLRKRITYTYSEGVHGTRQATNHLPIPSVTEQQTIVPGYVLNDVIIAMRVNTGVVVPGTEGDDEPATVSWLDINNDGRMWQVIR